ncbi:hypothetical protein AB5I41_13005 [Sphingomonas sp. MMS24-JH45]
MSYGHMLKTIGRQDEGVAAYRRAIDLRPALGEGVVEPRQPQDRPLRRGRHRHDGARARRRRRDRGSFPPRLRARQGVRGPG